MNNLRMVVYKSDHFDLLEIREQEIKDFRILGNSKEKMTALSQVGNCFTMMFDGRVLGVVGWFELWPGVYELFVLPTIYLSKVGITFARTMKRFLLSFEQTHKVRRIQITSIKDKSHTRWVSWLGFNIEGVLRHYGPNGEDYLIWGRYSNGN